MNKTKLAYIGEPILRKETLDVPINKIRTKEIQNIVKSLIYNMKEYKGAGLAANQIFEKYRICVLEVEKNDRYKHIPSIPLKVLINPRIIRADKNKIFSSYEGCLSVPNFRGRVNRSYDIDIEYYNEYGQFFRENIKGFAAIVYQHEIDHLDGVLFTDKVSNKKSLVTYDNYVKYFEDEYSEELINLFAKLKM